MRVDWLKKQNPERIQIVLFRVLFCVAAGIIMTRIIGFDTLSSLLYTLTFPLTVALWLFSVRKGLTWSDLFMLGIGVLAFLFVFLDLIRSGGHFSPSYFKKVIIFCMSLLFLQTCHRSWTGSCLAEMINRSIDLLTIFMLVMYIFFWDEMHMINNIVTRYATFQFSNPNLFALFASCLYMLKFCLFSNPCSEREKLIRFGVLIVLAILILDTRSRNALLCFLLFNGLALIYHFRGFIEKKTKLKLPMQVGKYPALGIAFAPILFVIFYMLLVNSKLVNFLLGFLSAEGKDLDSRVKTWQPAIDAIFDSPLIGSYFQISEGTGVSQMHNTHLDLAASYGIPVMVFFCLLLTFYLYQREKNYSDKKSFFFLLGFICALMLGIFEAALVSGGMGIYLFMGIFLLLANPNRAEDKVISFGKIKKNIKQVFKGKKTKSYGNQ